MPFATNNGIRIHYQLEGNADGQPLVLQHGFSGSLHNWHTQGYVAGLGDAYRLILIDARGHGQSDKPHDPDAYGVALQAADVVAVLEDLGLAQAHYFGYSMGGMIGYSLGVHFPERCRSLIIGGDGAGERDPNSPGYLGTLNLLRQGPDAWVSAFGSRLSPEAAERQRSNDFDALIADRSLVEHRGFAEALPGIAIPALIFAGDADGEHDGARAAASMMANARFVSLPGLGHLDAVFRSDLTLPFIADFLSGVG